MCSIADEVFGRSHGALVECLGLYRPGLRDEARPHRGSGDRLVAAWLHPGVMEHDGPTGGHIPGFARWGIRGLAGLALRRREQHLIQSSQPTSLIIIARL